MHVRMYESQQTFNKLSTRSKHNETLQKGFPPAASGLEGVKGRRKRGAERGGRMRGETRSDVGCGGVERGRGMQRGERVRGRGKDYGWSRADKERRGEMEQGARGERAREKSELGCVE